MAVLITTEEEPTDAEESSGDPSHTADTEIWICISCGYAGCSCKDHGGAMEYWEGTGHRWVMHTPADVVDTERLMFKETEISDNREDKFLKQRASEPKVVSPISGPTLESLTRPMPPDHKGKVGSKGIDLAWERMAVFGKLLIRGTQAAEAYIESITSSYTCSHNVNRSGSNLFNRRYDYGDI
jgi:hypothetical protein